MTDSSSSSRPGSQMGYGTLSGIIISTFERFLGWFTMSIQMSRGSGDSASVPTDFFGQFLVEADNFSSTCSREVAVAIRTASSQSEVRETSESVLTRLVRNRCFDQLDSILCEYLAVLAQLNVNVAEFRDRLGDSKVKEAVSRGQVMAGAGGEMRARGKSAAVLTIMSYLQQLEKVPHELLDYGAVKLFGAEADFGMQRGFLLSISDAIEPKYQTALAALQNFDEVKQKRWEDQRAAETAAVKEAALNAILYAETKKTGFGSLIVGAICALIIWVTFSMGVRHPYVLIGQGVVALVGLVFLCRGVANLVRR